MLRFLRCCPWARESAIVLLVFLPVALAVTWPLATNIATAIPRGTERVSTVPRFNLWTVWWNADRARHGLHSYWDAPIFYPSPDAFAYSEAQPTSIAVAPLFLMTGNPVVAYNIYLLAALTLNGYATHRLLRHIEMHPAVAIAGGVLVQTTPFVIRQLGVLQLVPLFGIVWTIHALLRFMKSPDWRRGVILGAAFAWTYAMCNYYGLFLSLLLPSAVVLFNRDWLRLKAWIGLLICGLTAAAIIAPIAVVQLRTSEQQEWSWNPKTIRSLSSNSEDFVVSAWNRPWHRIDPFSDRLRRRNLALNKLCTLAAIAGLIVGFVRKSTRRLTLFLAVFIACAVVLSFGPKLEFGGWGPYRILHDYYPGFAHVRTLYRFVVFVQLGIVFLAAISGNELFADRLWKWLPKKWSRPVPWMILIALTTLAVAETWRPAIRLISLDPAPWQAAWVDWLRSETPEESVIVCIPFVRGTTVTDYEVETEWMNHQIGHRRVILNGYSGHIPPRFTEMKRLMVSFPELQCLDELARVGVDYCVVWRGSGLEDQLNGDPAVRARLTRKYQDDEIEIYRLLPVSDDTVR